jgi:hypothetical protein
MPLEPREVYAIVPMAWRQLARTDKTSNTLTVAENVMRELAEVS